MAEPEPAPIDPPAAARADVPAAPAPIGVPRETTPTWEMELLLSGATVFGLLQLPHQLDLLLATSYARVTDHLGGLILAVWMYAKSALLVLIATFILHLALRGFWIALVGLDSVYPGGIRWDQLPVGPQQRAALERRVPAMAARIEVADNRATRVFGVGVGLAVALLVPLGLVAVAFLGMLLLRRLDLGDRAEFWAFWVLLVCMALPFALLQLVDRRFGRRIATEGRLGRAMQAGFRLSHRVGMGRVSNPLLAIFMSSGSARRTGLVVGAVIAAAVVAINVQFTMAIGGADFGEFPGLPDDEPGEPGVVSPGHYASQRGGEPSLVPVPYLPDRVVRGPYVELFVPFNARRMAPAMLRSCGDAVAKLDAGGPPEPALACLARVLDLRLDGQPLSVPLDASTDPVSGLRGALAMIPAEGLAPGRHELTISRPPIPGRGGPKDPPPKPWRIPFWR